MKLFYESENGYKVFSTKILGYPCDVHETTESGCLVSVPMGDNKKDIKMFDDLVYFNKSVYWARTKEKAIRQVREWIKNYH